jgi:outer membrane protein OmpA-like peptidoglycan-associated protein
MVNKIMMKQLIIILFWLNCCSCAYTQPQAVKKPATIGLHFFYNDFSTAQYIKANNLNFVLNNNLWSKPHTLQGGFGIDYLKGLTKKIDAVGTFNASWVNYLLPGYTSYGSSNFLLDINVGAHIKLFSDKKIINPFVVAKVGYNKYKNISGINLLPGLGLQCNLFNEVFIISTTEYRLSLNNSLSNQFYYSIGIATSIAKKKMPQPVDEKPAPPKLPEKEDAKPELVNEEPKIIIKDIAVTVNDEATGQPLQYVEVLVKNSEGNEYTAITNTDGKAIIAGVKQSDYTIKGRLNKIDATTVAINKNDFAKTGNQIPVSITHNDPRFTLIGNTVDKKADKPVGNTVVTITNTTQNSAGFATSNTNNGGFRTQLEGASDFEIAGKKANYISNIENISTKGLNRSATLYVKLQLNIEEAKVGTSIVLNKIYFETGKAIVNTSSSSDLDKLVRFLKDNPAAKLEIQGHTDNVGTLANNIKLSQLRANSIVTYLVKNGIENTRLLAKGYGFAMPIADNGTKEGKAQNRRVELKVLE